MQPTTNQNDSANVPTLTEYDKEYHNWSRHYDSVVWNIYSITATVMLALAAYAIANFHFLLPIFGVLASVVSFFFVASFRNFQRNLPIHNIRTSFVASQWSVITSLYITCILLWTGLFHFKTESEIWIHVMAGIIALLLCIIIRCIGVIANSKTKQ
ncbi:MAG: hypothetical protein HKN09_09045 [Saprospiraceae bacterium]|nr:hypothetical protein [Saprospiraceae bacterium]